MPQPLPRLRASLERREDERKLAAILIETGEAVPDEYNGRALTTSADGHRDDRRRGLPCIGRGVSGAMNGSDPLRALLAKERRRRR